MRAVMSMNMRFIASTKLSEVGGTTKYLTLFFLYLTSLTHRFTPINDIFAAS